MLVIDKGMFHNYFHMCNQLFLCDVIDISFASFSPFYKGAKEKGGKSKDHGTVDITSSE